MLEDHLFSARVSDALDHGGVVHAVGEDDAIGEFAAESCEGCVVSHVAGREDKSCFLGMQTGNG